MLKAMKTGRWSALGAVVLGAGALAGDFNRDSFDDAAVGCPGDNMDKGTVTVITGAVDGLTGTAYVLSLDTAGVPGTAVANDRFGAAMAVGNFNGDNYPDLAVGVPNRAVGGDAGAGEVVIFYGSASGLTGTDSQVFTQDSSGIADSSEPGDAFGTSLAAGDLDGNGYDDLAIGVPYEVVAGEISAGGVAVIYGSVTGLASAGNQFWTQNSTGIAGVAEYGDTFGYSLAIGDFQSDGYGDLAIGVAWEDGAAVNQGAVHVLRGSVGRLTATDSQLWSQDSAGIAGVGEQDDTFGFSLAAGSFGNGGGDDLAIGVPWEDASQPNCGAINIIYGSLAEGLRSSKNVLITQDSADVVNREDAEDRFGYALAAGKINNDVQSDLVIGIPYEDIGAAFDAGGIEVLYGSAGGLTGVGSQFFSQDTSGIFGEPDTSDRFGYGVAVTDGRSFNGDDRADVLIGVPREDGILEDFGAVAVIRGSTTGLVSTGNQLLDQDWPGIPGQGVKNDQFGESVAAK